MLPTMLQDSIIKQDKVLATNLVYTTINISFVDSQAKDTVTK
jgi:hypothetical protein